MIHPECYKAYVIRRIDRLYAIVDGGQVDKIRGEQILNEIKHLTNSLPKARI